jgi:hypothetical protein
MSLVLEDGEPGSGLRALLRILGAIEPQTVTRGKAYLERVVGMPSLLST